VVLRATIAKLPRFEARFENSRMPMRTRPARASRVASLLAAGAIACLIGIASFHARVVTEPLQWPYDADLFRDMASAQNILQGDWFADPYYSRESLWYNPLVPALLAAASGLSGVPLHRLYAAHGWAFNLVVPMALAALVWRVAGRWAALASLAVFLFLPSAGVPPWAWATYSPWLFPTVFAQALFYLTLLALDRAVRSWRWRTFALFGGLLGLTFLAHSAPALLAGGVLVVEAMRRLLEPRRQTYRSFLSRTSAALALALVVSLPLTTSIVGRYHLRILNPSPMAWEYSEASIAALPRLLGGVVTAPGTLGLAGVWWLLAHPARRSRARILIGWLVSNLAWLSLMYAVQVLARLGWSVPTLLPDYHFLFYWRGLTAVLAGCGIFGLATLASERFAIISSSLRRSSGTAKPPLDLRSIAAGLTVIAVITATVIAYPRFSARYDLTTAVSLAKQRDRELGARRAWDWIRTSTPRDATFLADDEVGVFVVGPAGRRTVAVGPFFSNPYVDRNSRVAARTDMWRALQAGDAARFCGLARPLHVTHVVLDEEHAADWAGRTSGILSLSFGASGVRIWTVVGCGTT
jgi:hypothetical protein